MRQESSEEIDRALRSAKVSVGKEAQYNTRMDIPSSAGDILAKRSINVIFFFTSLATTSSGVSTISSLSCFTK